MAGRVAPCAGCGAKFSVGKDGRTKLVADAESDLSSDAGAAPPHDPPKATEGGPKWIGQRNPEFAAATRPAATAPQLPPPPPISPSPARQPTPTTAPAPASRFPASPSPPAPPPATREQRRPRRARFISADPTATNIELGADGRLPELRLAEAAKKERAGQSEQKSSPWLMVIVLAVSVGLSVLMLFVDTQPAARASDSAAQARRRIEEHYIGETQPFRPYQIKLRAALQAHAQGDREEERDRYREVLDMLMAEDKNDKQGITGFREETTPPNDMDLKQQLETLLREL